MARIVWSMGLVTILIVCFTTVLEAITLEEVKERGELKCGVSAGVPGFSAPDGEGRWSGLNVDLCRAVAAAALGDSNRVTFIPLTDRSQMTALQSGEVDLLSKNISWTMTRDTSLGLHFTGITFHDGQGFLTRKKLEIISALELDGAAICLREGSAEEAVVRAYFQEHNMSYQVVATQGPAQDIRELAAGRCEVVSGRRSALYAQLTELEESDAFVVLPEVISREPLGPIVRQGDDAWFNLVRWTLYAMINAEAYGVSSATIEAARTSPDPTIRRLLGLEGIGGKGLGVNDDWAYQVIRQVGNYGEMYERNVGLDSPLKMDRGLNGLWNRGGILYAPPMR